jgi:hypothetical protein
MLNKEGKTWPTFLFNVSIAKEVSHLIHSFLFLTDGKLGEWSRFLVHGFWLHRAELVQNTLGKSNRDRSAKNRGSCNRWAKLKNVNNRVRKIAMGKVCKNIQKFDCHTF